MARTKTVFPRHQVAHVWAQQSQDHGHEPGRRFYFNGPTIYSYGGHFPIARFVEHKGKKAVFFTLDSYSNTTAKHIHAARSAVSNYRPDRLFHVPHVERTDHEAARQSYESRLKDAVELAVRSRSRFEERAAACERIAAEGNCYADFFGLRWKIEYPVFDDALRERCRKARAAELEKRREAEERRREREAYRPLQGAIWLGRWKAGASDAGYIYDAPWTALRVKGDVIQTSRGAEFPLEHGKRVFRILRALKEQGRTYERNGHSIHLGHFVIDKFDGNTVRAGCHEVPWFEVEDCATKLGLL